VGIVSIGDVVNAHVEETEFENRQLKDYIRNVLSVGGGSLLRRGARSPWQYPVFGMTMRE
jgi:hypothetical protein